jgi:hypothetical protein
MVAQVVFGLPTKSALASRIWAAISSFLLVAAEISARNGDPVRFGF